MPDTDADGPMSTPARREAAGANVIRFPSSVRLVPEAAALRTDDAAARLDRALLALNQALATQREAVRLWRQNLGELASSVSSLANNLHILDAGWAAVSAGLKAGTGENGRDAIALAEFKEAAGQQRVSALISGTVARLGVMRR